MLEIEKAYCELCGKEIISPNYSTNHGEGMYETFDECAECDLVLSVEQYMGFKDDFKDDSEFHIRQLNYINQILINLNSNFFLYYLMKQDEKLNTILLSLKQKLFLLCNGCVNHGESKFLTAFIRNVGNKEHRGNFDL